MQSNVRIASGLFLRPMGVAAAFGLVVAACADPSVVPAAGVLATSPPQEGARRSSVDVAPYAAAHKANPADPAAALAYAGVLRTNGAKREALAVLDRVSAGQSNNRRLQLERGLLALDIGEPAKAEGLLRQAHDPKAPDWRLHSGLGAALASRGKQQEAQAQFAKALALAPDQPVVLNNLALSYALDGKVSEAEKILRRIHRGSTDVPQVKQNLALVLGLNRKYEEARAVGESALPAAKAGENVAYLRRLTSTTPGPRQAESDAVPGPSAVRKPAPTNASLPQPT